MSDVLSMAVPATAPAMARVRAKIRIAIFISGSSKGIVRGICSLLKTRNRLGFISKSSNFNVIRKY
jgi:hypothetical protein